MINITREQFFEFIKTKKDKAEAITSATQHYLNFFDKYQKTAKKGNWNWASSFLVWFFYRRMYEYGFFITVLPLMLYLINYKIFGVELGEVVNGCLSICFLVFWMRYADYGYLYYASKKIFKGKKTSGVHNKLFAIFITFVIIFFVSVFIGLAFYLIGWV